MRAIASAAALLLAAGCASTPQLQPHDPAPQAKPDPVTCPVIAVNGPLAVKYPAKAFEVGQEGWAHVRFDIDEQGAATNIRSLGASPPGVFDAAARSTIEQTRFLSVKEKDCEFVFEYHKDPPK